MYKDKEIKDYFFNEKNYTTLKYLINTQIINGTPHIEIKIFKGIEPLKKT